MDKKRRAAQEELDTTARENTKETMEDSLNTPNNLNHEPDRSGTLDDEKRVKVLSPGTMVFKRFIRNRLAITGFVILVIMFLFSFLGGVLMPYSQSQVFTKTDFIIKDYAGATINTELRYTVKEGETFSSSAFSQLILAKNDGQLFFSSNDKYFTYAIENEDFFRIKELDILSDVSARKQLYAYRNAPGFDLSADMRSAFELAHSEQKDKFTFDNKEYNIIRDGLKVMIASEKETALASPRIYDAYEQNDIRFVESYAFRNAVEEAISRNLTSFTLDAQEYSIQEDGRNTTVYKVSGNDKTLFANISDIVVNALSVDVFLTVDYKAAAREAIINGGKEFIFPDEEGNDIEYRIVLVHNTYNIKRSTQTHLIDMYRSPDEEHLLGTDQNGMDVLTRLMYGGRISLLVGFVVVFLEMMIGIVVGGISGYFGGWVDTMLMRFVDLFNSVPYWPIMIIVGSVMDTLEVNPYTRVFLLMFILGLMGWTGIARVVRGQILALREQDFMVATEATGIRISRRIFRHLVPNVMPLLIVQGTMSLGSIILTEATLSFLGLGVKYPIASWGSIITAASNPYVVTNFWFIWIPAGLLILLTVLGFNFVGDGLRDAFDPKMKR